MFSLQGSGYSGLQGAQGSGHSGLRVFRASGLDPSIDSNRFLYNILPIQGIQGIQGMKDTLRATSKICKIFRVLSEMRGEILVYRP